MSDRLRGGGIAAAARRCAPPATDTLRMREPTELRRVPGLYSAERELDLYAKLELTNPTGTHKDRVAERVVRRALDLGSKCVTAGTCGNYGVALARCCSRAGLDYDAFIPSRYEGSRWGEITLYGGRVLWVEGTYEEAVALSRAHAESARCYDANPAGEAGEIALAAYEEIAREIMGQLSAAPSSVWVPVGNGTTLGGLFRGFLKAGATPRLGAVGSRNNTAATASARLGRSVELDPLSLSESGVNEPLVNWRSLHADLVVEAIRQSAGYVYDASDGEMLAAARALKEFGGIAVAPAAAAPAAALRHYLHLMDEHSGPHVLLLTSAAFRDAQA